MWVRTATPLSLMNARILPLFDCRSLLRSVWMSSTFGTPAHSIVGRPHVPGAVVRARVAEQTRDAKVVIFKKRRRKGYQRKKGFRRYVTVLEILGIEAPEVREAPSDAPEQPAAA